MSAMAESITADRVAAVREFNRFYTSRIRVLGDGFLRTPYSLSEARVLFELGQRDSMEVSDLRAALNIDAGQLSRLLSRLESAGLVARERSSEDARRQRARLTPAGSEAFAELDARSAEEIGRLLEGVGEDGQVRLVGAMRVIRSLLDADPSAARFQLREPRSGDYGWVVERHGALYAEEYGWDESFEALVARIVADYVDERDPEREAAWIAEADGERVGCVFCVPASARVAKLRLLLVEPHARGMGVGGALVDECLRFARAAGYQEIALWTNDVLEDARRIYERAGFELAEQERHHSFGHDLVGQNWSRQL
jgi:DNA-binding MarR family transcriptional regulator/GNAT superfamily N-acetyltransferase